MPQFEVIGEGGEVYYVSGQDIMGVLGYDDDDIDGDDDYDDYVGAKRRKKLKRRRGGGMVRVKEADWRKRQLAPGVQAPDQGVYPLSLAPSNNTGIFAVGVPAIQFTGRLQKPFRGERLLTRVVRTGATATGTLLGRLFVGTDLQGASIRGINVENVGDPQAFGVRLTMVPAQPGVDITIEVVPTVIPGGTDTIAVDIEILGRIVA